MAFIDKKQSVTTAPPPEMPAQATAWSERENKSDSSHLAISTEFLHIFTEESFEWQGYRLYNSTLTLKQKSIKS